MALISPCKHNSGPIANRNPTRRNVNLESTMHAMRAMASGVPGSFHQLGNIIRDSVKLIDYHSRKITTRCRNKIAHLPCIPSPQPFQPFSSSSCPPQFRPRSSTNRGPPSSYENPLKTDSIPDPDRSRTPWPAGVCRTHTRRSLPEGARNERVTAADHVLIWQCLALLKDHETGNVAGAITRAGVVMGC